jgi:prophage regulatory protein
MSQALERIRRVPERSALSRSELYRRIGLNQFPRPVAIGKRAVAWRSSDIDAWIASRSPKAQGAQGGEHV